jgi:hypothetical protein
MSAIVKHLFLAFGMFLVFIACNSDVAGQTRVRFARGRTSASVSGALMLGQRRTYLLRAVQGQQLSGNVSSRNACVKFIDGATSVAFTTEAGDNRVSIKNHCRARATFVVTVSIN